MSLTRRPKSRVLPPDFYLQDTVEVARKLIGCILVRRTSAGLISGRIIETEAYITGDPANHAFRGMTNRNKTMFGPPARAYVYHIHRWHCLNLVTQPEGVAEAVLIRAVEPLEGIDIMTRNRRCDRLKLLAAGPGRLCQAFAIDEALDGADLTRGAFTVLAGETPGPILNTTRVGVAAGKDLPLRFLLQDSPFVAARWRQP